MSPPNKQTIKITLRGSVPAQGAVLSRTEFNKLPHPERNAFFRNGGRLVDDKVLALLRPGTAKR